MAGRLGNSKRLGDDYLSLHGRVIEELRQAILSRRLKPGERLVEGRLADELGVSRNPVREAIRVLESEGLVEVTARRGASVVTMSDEEARETIEVRALLEGQNARLAARRREESIIKRIAAVLKQGNEAVAARRYDLLSDLNQQFHHELAEAGRNRVLADLLKRLRERTAMLFAPTDPVRQARTWDEHAAILRAIIAGDERAAATLAAEHVMRAGADFLSSLHVPDEDASLEQMEAKYGLPSASSNPERALATKPARRGEARPATRRRKTED
ncbi:GntR family transcriptional regulator [Bradyrhizobium macuxiense]|uniref:GntR family transcriptional regulator n=1 Tax=Bradyrhizobium macuxiense TaxID=1755647 RepID=UPI00082A4B33|nr:GntR family transcriptional regulator [Bradyrhizobium macuxiense]